VHRRSGARKAFPGPSGKVIDGVTDVTSEMRRCDRLEARVDISPLGGESHESVREPPCTRLQE
jgi:hypothetical protein